jgi:hypothetical protein
MHLCNSCFLAHTQLTWPSCTRAEVECVHGGMPQHAVSAHLAVHAPLKATSWTVGMRASGAHLPPLAHGAESGCLDARWMCGARFGTWALQPTSKDVSCRVPTCVRACGFALMFACALSGAHRWGGAIMRQGCRAKSNNRPHSCGRGTEGLSAKKAELGSLTRPCAETNALRMQPDAAGLA